MGWMTLLLAFQVKHFVADYPLQNKYMLGKFLKYPAYIKPLMAHCLVHGLFTFGIALLVKPELALWLAMFDMAAHGIMDRIKASPDLLGKFKPLTKDTYLTATAQQLKSNTYFWWALGLDQMTHHITHYIIIWMLL